MTWTYHQASGQMFDGGGNLLGNGYSGNGAGKNNPAMQNVVKVGPLPQGGYTIMGPPRNETEPGGLGPYILDLDPDGANQMFGRSLFRIHGDSISHPGDASDGCIVLAPQYRHTIWNSGDRRLAVIA
jgi:hypothetical protein